MVAREGRLQCVVQGGVGEDEGHWGRGGCCPARRKSLELSTSRTECPGGLAGSSVWLLKSPGKMMATVVEKGTLSWGLRSPVNEETEVTAVMGEKSCMCV